MVDGEGGMVMLDLGQKFLLVEMALYKFSVIV